MESESTARSGHSEWSGSGDAVAGDAGSGRKEADVKEVVGVRHVLGEPLEWRVQRGLDAVHHTTPAGLQRSCARPLHPNP